MSDFWSNLYTLFKTSALIQGLLAVGCTATIGYIFVTGKQAPQPLIDITLMIVGYYFGSKQQQAINQGSINDVTRRLDRIDDRTDTSTK